MAYKLFPENVKGGVKTTVFASIDTTPGDCSAFYCKISKEAAERIFGISLKNSAENRK